MYFLLIQVSLRLLQVNVLEPELALMYEIICSAPPRKKNTGVFEEHKTRHGDNCHKRGAAGAAVAENIPEGARVADAAPALFLKTIERTTRSDRYRLNLKLSNSIGRTELHQCIEEGCRLRSPIVPSDFRSCLTQILPLEDQTLVKGHLLFSLFPWHDFDYAGELEKSNASRSLQVGPPA